MVIRYIKVVQLDRSDIVLIHATLLAGVESY